MNENEMNVTYEDSANIEKFSYKGVATKTFIGVLFTVFVTIFVIYITNGSFVLYGFGGIIAVFVAYFVLKFLRGILSADTSMPTLIFGLICIVQGILFASFVNIMVYYAASFGLSGNALALVFVVTGVLTASVVLGTLFVVATQGEKLENSSTFANLGKIFMSTMLVILIVAGISFVLGLLGLDFFSNIYYQISFSDSIFGIGISVFFVLYACYFLARTLLEVKSLRDSGASESQEWIAASILTYSIISIYMEILRLILRIISRARR